MQLQQLLDWSIRYSLYTKPIKLYLPYK